MQKLVGKIANWFFKHSSDWKDYQRIKQECDCLREKVELLGKR